MGMRIADSNCQVCGAGASIAVKRIRDCAKHETHFQFCTIRVRYVKTIGRWELADCDMCISRVGLECQDAGVTRREGRREEHGTTENG